MTMTAPDFLARYRTFRAQLETLSASPELQAAGNQLVAAFKAAYTSESLKDAVAASAPVPADLEERLTSATVLLNRERTLNTSRQVPEGLETSTEET